MDTSPCIQYLEEKKNTRENTEENTNTHSLQCEEFLPLIKLHNISRALINSKSSSLENNTFYTSIDGVKHGHKHLRTNKLPEYYQSKDHHVQRLF